MIYGVSFDAPEQNRAFAEKNHFGYGLLSDLDRSLGLAYGAADSASAGAARRIGVIIGEDGRVVAYQQKASPADFPRQALEIVRGAPSGG